MAQAIPITDVQFTDADPAKLRRLADDLRRTQVAVNSALQLITALQAQNATLTQRVQSLEAQI